MKKNNKFPYIIHASSDAQKLFPTHTHGLSDIDMPELLIDPLAILGPDCGMMINDIYLYLSNPKNSEALNSILNGETVTINSKDLCSCWSGFQNMCFRKVSSEFEAVKLAYQEVKQSTMQKMQFIQIYIEGEEFVLDDDYYKDGNMW